MLAQKKLGRKCTSRDRLLEAARTICAEGRYLRCSVEDIANEAGVSRAGFYMHFSSKDELLSQLVEDQVEWHVRQFRTVSTDALRTEAGLLAWFQQFIDRYRNINEMMAQFRFAMHVKDAFAQNHAVRLRVMETLGHRIPELAIFHSDGSFDLERLAALQLWIYQLEQMCLNVAFAPHTVAGTEGLKLLARHFMELLKPPR
jgi:AcrR family transcriptional regulator